MLVPYGYCPVILRLLYKNSCIQRCIVPLILGDPSLKWEWWVKSTPPLNPTFIYKKKLGFAGVYLFFLIFAPKLKLWILGEAVLTCTHNQCFGAKTRENRYTPAYIPLHTLVLLHRGYTLHGHVFMMKQEKPRIHKVRQGDTLSLSKTAAGTTMMIKLGDMTDISIEPRREKTGLRGFRPGLTQTGLYKLRKELEAWNFGFKKKRNCTIRVAKTKALISFAVTAKLICAFVFA